METNMLVLLPCSNPIVGQSHQQPKILPMTVDSAKHSHREERQHTGYFLMWVSFIIWQQHNLQISCDNFVYSYVSSACQVSPSKCRLCAMSLVVTYLFVWLQMMRYSTLHSPFSTWWKALSTPTPTAWLLEYCFPEYCSSIDLLAVVVLRNPKLLLEAKSAWRLQKRSVASLAWWMYLYWNRHITDPHKNLDRTTSLQFYADTSRTHS